LTLIEMLVSLALLSGLMLAVVSWTQAAARSGAELAGPHAWRSAAERIIGLIHDDIQSGDWRPRVDDRTTRQPLVQLENGELTIRTRSAGEVVHRYQLDAPGGELSLSSTDGSARSAPRLLLQQVKEWTCAIEQIDEPPLVKRRLSITITGNDGTMIVGTFQLEDVA